MFVEILLKLGTKTYKDSKMYCTSLTDGVCLSNESQASVWDFSATQ